MFERAMLVLLLLACGVLIGLCAPGVVPLVHDAQQAQQTFLQPPTAEPTAVPFLLTRPVPAQTAVPPTLVAPPPPTPEPTPVKRSFTIPLKDGGEMTVNASDHAAAIINVKSTGAIPDED